MNTANSALLLPLMIAVVGCAGQPDELPPAAQHDYELLCQNLQMEYLYGETQQERDVAEDRINRLECNRSVSSAEKDRRDADHWRSMRDRSGPSAGNDIRTQPRDNR